MSEKRTYNTSKKQVYSPIIFSFLIKSEVLVISQLRKTRMLAYGM